MNTTGPFILGLTGSIGMGKSTTASFFKEFGVPVWDADAAVHELYETKGAAVERVGELAPNVVQNGAVDRQHLKDWISRTPNGLERLEKIVHPLVAQSRAQFLDNAKIRDDKIVVVDIPLLFETGAQEWCDATVVVSAPQDVQRARVMGRPNMTEEHFTRILEKQMPDSQKQILADYVILSDTFENTRLAVKNLLDELIGQIDQNA